MNHLPRFVWVLLFPFLAVCFTAQGQVPDSTRKYVLECIDVMQKQSLYSAKLDWRAVRDSVERQLQHAKTTREAEASVIWVFSQLGDDHGYYGGVDTSYRYKKPGPDRVLSKGLLAQYQVPRSIRTAMLDKGIAYYKMPAVLIGSDTAKMRDWANRLTDSLCKLEALKPRGYVIDLRMNNGGNSEPMWTALKPLIGIDNRTYYADAKGNILPDDTSAETRAYLASATASHPCSFRKNIPVAVLIGPGTASSGEIMALAFSTRKNTRSFGEPTIGVANVTNGFVIQDKGYLLLTVGYIADAKKKILRDFQLIPDVEIRAQDNYLEPAKDPTVMAAMKWLMTRSR